MNTLPDRLLADIDSALRELDAVTAPNDEVADRIGCAENAMRRAREAAAALSGRSPSYDALLIIAQSVCGALERAGLTDCDDPGEAIDVLREGYEKRIAALSGREAVGEIDEGEDGMFATFYPDRDLRRGAKLYTTPQPGDGVDAARLDWLRDNEFDLVTRREDIDEDEYRILWFVIDPRKTTRRHLHSISGHPLGSPREAIDAAIARSAAPSAKGVA